MKIRTLATLTVLAATSLAYAQLINDSFIYQGTFMDGGVAANGPYDINFSVYDSPVGGSIVPNGTDSHFFVPVVDGLFEVFVDFNISGSVFDSNQTRWLQISVRENGGPNYIPLLPRQRMAPAPLANYALRSGTSLQGAYENGSTIFRGAGDLPVEIRSDGTLPARLNLGSELGSEEPGRFYIYTKDGGAMFFAEQDVSTGGGAFFQSARNNSGLPGFTVDGNFSSTESTRVTIRGASSSIVLSTDTTGDDTVILPVDAINATEILNEVGFTEDSFGGAVFLSNDPATIEVVRSITIDCPTDGHVFVIASAELTVSHTTGTQTSVNLAVSNSSTSIPLHGDLETRHTSNSPTGEYDHIATTHAIFAANTGSNTFYFLGDVNSGGALVSDIQLSAIFIPTAYGAVAREAGQGLPDELTPVSGPMTNYDIVMEQNAALQASVERQQREMDAMKAQMQQIIEQTQQTLQQQRQD